MYLVSSGSHNEEGTHGVVIVPNPALAQHIVETLTAVAEANHDDWSYYSYAMVPVAGSLEEAKEQCPSYFQSNVQEREEDDRFFNDQ